MLAHLTAAELAAVTRAEQLLQRTHYDDADGIPERVQDARYCAYNVLELAAALDAERGSRLALKERCARQEGLLGARAYGALEAASRG